MILSHYLNSKVKYKKEIPSTVKFVELMNSYALLCDKYSCYINTEICLPIRLQWVSQNTTQSTMHCFENCVSWKNVPIIRTSIFCLTARWIRVYNPTRFAISAWLTLMEGKHRREVDAETWLDSPSRHSCLNYKQTINKQINWPVWYFLSFQLTW